jgi:hypothetical protein
MTRYLIGDNAVGPINGPEAGDEPTQGVPASGFPRSQLPRLRARYHEITTNDESPESGITWK